MIAGAAMLIGLFGGIEIQGCRDAVPTAAATQTAAPAVPTPEPRTSVAPADRPKPSRRTEEKARGSTKFKQ
jgi:hypothetical protein